MREDLASMGSGWGRSRFGTIINTRASSSQKYTARTEEDVLWVRKYLISFRIIINQYKRQQQKNIIIIGFEPRLFCYLIHFVIAVVGLWCRIGFRWRRKHGSTARLFPHMLWIRTKKRLGTSPFGQRCVWSGHFGTLWDILGQYWTFWDNFKRILRWVREI